ncbi:TPA: hypothetical protein DEP21_00145 [Patescibacteria group bacterium]|nr:hypothetical protein [Candidatus Gracilibacteria bacterium]
MVVMSLYNSYCYGYMIEVSRLEKKLINKKILSEWTSYRLIFLIFLIAGGILYLYRDTIKGKYTKTSGKVKKDVKE